MNLPCHVTFDIHIPLFITVSVLYGRNVMSLRLPLDALPGEPNVVIMPAIAIYDKQPLQS